MRKCAMVMAVAAALAVGGGEAAAQVQFGVQANLDNRLGGDGLDEVCRHAGGQVGPTDQKVDLGAVTRQVQGCLASGVSGAHHGGRKAT